MIELSKQYVRSNDAQDTSIDAKETSVNPKSKCPVRKNKWLNPSLISKHQDIYSQSNISVSDNEEIDSDDSDVNEINLEEYEQNKNEGKAVRNLIYMRKIKIEMRKWNTKVTPQISIDHTTQIDTWFADDSNKSNSTKSIESELSDSIEENNFKAISDSVPTEKRVEQTCPQIITDRINTCSERYDKAKATTLEASESRESQAKIELNTAEHCVKSYQSEDRVELKQACATDIDKSEDTRNKLDTGLDEDKVAADCQEASLESASTEISRQAVPSDQNLFVPHSLINTNEASKGMIEIGQISCQNSLSNVIEQVTPTVSQPEPYWKFTEYDSIKEDYGISLDIIQRIESGKLPRINVVFDLDHTLIHGIKSEFVKDSQDLQLLSDLKKKNQVYEMFVENDEITRELHNLRGLNTNFQRTNLKTKYYLILALKPLNDERTKFDILEQLHRFADLYISTASLNPYCKEVMKIIDPSQRYFKEHRIVWRSKQNIKSLANMFCSEIVRNNPSGIDQVSRLKKIKEMKERTIIVDDSPYAWWIDDKAYMYHIKQFKLNSRVFYEKPSSFLNNAHPINGYHPLISEERLSNETSGTSKQLQDFFQYASRDFMIGLYGCQKPLKSSEIFSHDIRSILKGYRLVTEFYTTFLKANQSTVKHHLNSLLMTMGAEIIMIDEGIKDDPAKIYEFLISNKIDFIIYLNMNNVKNIQLDKIYEKEDIRKIKVIQKLMEGKDEIGFLDINFILLHFFKMKYMSRKELSSCQTKVIFN